MSVIIIPSGSSISRQQKISEEVTRRDYADISKRELAISVGDWSWDQGYSEAKDVVFFSRAFVLVIIFTVTGFGWFFLGAVLK